MQGLTDAQFAWDVSAALIGCVGARLTIDHRNWVVSNVDEPNAHLENNNTYVFAAIYQFAAPAILLLLQIVVSAIFVAVGGFVIAKLGLQMLKNNALSFSALLVFFSLIYFGYRGFMLV